MSKRKGEEEASGASEAKHKRHKGVVYTFGGAKVDEITPVDWKKALDSTLPRFKLVEYTEATSQRPGMQPRAVGYEPIKKKALKVLEHLPSANMRIAPLDAEDPTLIDSELAGNAKFQKWVFDPINQVFAQWEGDDFVRRWRMQMHPADAPKERVDSQGASSRNTADDPNALPDKRCKLVISDDCQITPSAEVAVDAEGKRWGVFWGGLPDEVIQSGKLDLYEAYTEGTLSEHGKHALFQCCKYMFDDQLDWVILYTLPVLWVIRCANRKNQWVTVSEPVTAKDTNPSMKQVVFAVVYHGIQAAKENLPNPVSMPLWLRKTMDAQSDSLPRGLDDGAAHSDEESGVFGGDATHDELARGKTGDQLLSQLDEVQRTYYGNSIVHIGRINGVKVAVKIVPSGAERWVHDEIKNEGRALDALKPLQGLVVPELVFVGRSNGGHDRILITRYVEGDRLDEVSVTDEVVAKARGALREIHDRGFLHADVSPRNILIQSMGKCVFLDLGRARQATNTREKTTEMAELETWLRLQSYR